MVFEEYFDNKLHINVLSTLYAVAILFVHAVWYCRFFRCLSDLYSRHFMDRSARSSSLFAFSPARMASVRFSLHSASNQAGPDRGKWSTEVSNIHTTTSSLEKSINCVLEMQGSRWMLLPPSYRMDKLTVLLVHYPKFEEWFLGFSWVSVV